MRHKFSFELSTLEKLTLAMVMYHLHDTCEIVLIKHLAFLAITKHSISFYTRTVWLTTIAAAVAQVMPKRMSSSIHTLKIEQK